MKRPPPSFSIEIRRRPGRAVDPGVNARLFETKVPLSEFSRETHRAAAALFAPSSAVVAPIAVPPNAPRGRVLPALVVEPEPREASPILAKHRREPPLADEPALRSRHEPTSPSKSREVAPPLADERPADVSYPRASDAAQPTGPAPVDGAKSSTRKRISKQNVNRKLANAQHRQAATSSEDRAPASAVADLQISPSKSNEAPARVRKRTILERYVYRSELKPGQRWKSRLGRKH